MHFTPHNCIDTSTQATGNLRMRNAKLRKGNLRNKLRNALWLVGRN